MKASRLAFPIVAAAVLLALLLAFHALSTARSVAIWLLVVAAALVLELARQVRAGDDDPHRQRFEAALRPRPTKRALPAELERMERELVLGTAGAAYAERRLLPLLRAAAAARLGSRRGIELERRPDVAREALGDDVWDLLRPDRPAPPDRDAPGPSRARIAAAIERLETL